MRGSKILYSFFSFDRRFTGLFLKDKENKNRVRRIKGDVPEQFFFYPIDSLYGFIQRW